MASSTFPDTFKKSYVDSANYPLNLAYVMPITSPKLLEGLHEHLNETSTKLFVENEKDVEIPWRDLGVGPALELQKLNIHSTEKLAEMMGFKIDESTLAVTAYRRDPQCRFIYISGQTSLSALDVTRQIFTKILSFHQVMPAYLDFVMAFGQQEEPKDLRFSSFKKQVSLAPSVRMPNIPELDRSGQQFQLCYNLKHIARKDNVGFSNIRQAAFHHQFDVITGKTLWIVTAGRRDLQERYKDLTGEGAKVESKSFKTPIECFRSSLAAHTMFCAWAIENWRWYIKSLENNLEAATRLTILGPRGEGEHHQEYQPGDLQTLQSHEDVVHETLAALEANMRVFSSLQKFYSCLKKNEHFPLRRDGAEYIDLFTDQVGEFISDIEHLVQRASTLLKITDGRKQLVVQHFQSQSTENMEKMNSNMEKEAILMRIITIVTLIYLPATFVSFLLHRNDEMVTGSATFDSNHAALSLGVESSDKATVA
ncbi:hypothetical protein FHL15_007931 [Xylaria flabelliformis]|uniref:CorA-like transporter domain-containing protein n=1 Tax=Xylaria flabelliformis TaxID=2512241 RepID=A0A553HT65_9PEZI|nr:hypothetical protein FHL15_007931 [Xylaria flabelliformis]